MMLIGIVTGLVAAFLQSVCYVISGSYVRRTGKPGWTLTAPQQTLMIAPYALLAYFTRPESLDGFWAGALPPLAVVAVAAYCGNTGLFQMQKSVEPSRTAPLQSVKIPIIALVSFLFLGRSFSAVQLFAIALIVGSAWLLCGAGKRIRLSAWLWLLFCTTGYAFSDLWIGRVIEVSSLRIDSVLRNSLFALGLTHVASGLFNVPALVIQKTSGAPMPTAREWLRYAAVYGLTWFAAMAFLFVAFATAGVVLGTMAQATRALISVGLGWFLARHGFADVEGEVPRSVFVRRVFAAAGIMTAIVLYSTVGRP